MKSSYLNNLEREFYFVSDEEREQIIGEYQVHFEERIKDGATEAEVINNLGSPKTVAIEYANELDLKYSTLEKQLSNFKRDSNVYINSLKRKMNNLRNEEAAKRRNLKQYSTGENNEQTIDNPHNHHHNSATPNSNRFVRVISSLLNAIFGLIIRILFLCKIVISFCWRIAINFTAFIIGVWFGLNALTMIVIGIFLPIFVTFVDFKITIWLIIYGTILSLVVFFATISVLCLKRFGSIANE